MPKPRILNAAKKSSQQEFITSEFMITINPNKTNFDENSASYRDMYERLETLGNYILSKKNIPKFLNFVDRDNIIRDREEHLALIKEIHDDRFGVIERNKQYRLHLHLNFKITHSTRIQINREKVRYVASVITKVPEKSIHINFRGETVNFASYLAKNL